MFNFEKEKCKESIIGFAVHFLAIRSIFLHEVAEINHDILL